MTLLYFLFLFAEEEITPFEELPSPEIEIYDDLDTIDPIPPIEIEHPEQTEVFPGFYLPKSPGKASLLSAFIPGAGQYYNDRYIKSGLVFGIQVGLILRTVHHNERVNRFRHRSSDYDKQRYIDAYDARQSFIFWIGTSALLSAMDAYVDAHLINFQKLKEEIHLRFEEEKVIISIRF